MTENSGDEVKSGEAPGSEVLPPVPDWAERTYLLGLLVEKGAALEFVTSHFAWTLLGKGAREGELLTRRMSLSQVLRLIGDLAPHALPQDLQPPTQEALRLARAAALRRNEYIHSMWTEQIDADGTATAGRLKVNLDPTNEADYVVHGTPREDIVTALSELQEAQSRLVSIWFEVDKRWNEFP